MQSAPSFAAVSATTASKIVFFLERVLSNRSLARRWTSSSYVCQGETACVVPYDIIVIRRWWFVQQIVTIGPKSQVVIPKSIRKLSPALQPGKKVTVRSLSPKSVIIESADEDWAASTYGMHKKIWQGVDATDYIRKLRDQWEKNA